MMPPATKTLDPVIDRRETEMQARAGPLFLRSSVILVTLVQGEQLAKGTG